MACVEVGEEEVLLVFCNFFFFLDPSLRISSNSSNDFEPVLYIEEGVVETEAAPAGAAPAGVAEAPDAASWHRECV